MAYAFSAIDELLKGQESQQNKNDLFGAVTNPLAGSQEQGFQPNIDKKFKTVDEGGAASQPYKTESTKKQESVKSTPRTLDRAAYAANVGKTEQPKALGDVQGQITANEKRLQDEANKYTESETAKQKYALGATEIESAIGPQKTQEAWQNVSGLLSRPNINEVSQFKPTDVGIDDLNLLKTSAGQKNLVSRGQDVTYTPGMASFDVRALQQTPQFNETVRNMMASQDLLEKERAEKIPALQTQIEEQGAANLAQAQADARKYLQDVSQGLIAANDQEAIAYNQQLANLDLNAIAAQKEQEAAEQARLNLLQMYPEYAQNFLDPNLVDETKYITRGADLSGQDFVSADEAQKYNNILSLLGEGGQAWQQSLPADDPSRGYSVDQQSLRDALIREAEQGYGEYKTKTEEIIAARQARLDALAQNELERINQEIATQQTPEWLKSEAQKAYEASDLGGEYGKFYTDDMLDPSQYGLNLQSPELTGRDFLTQKEADRMNELYKTIGSPKTVQAGTYNKSINPYSFDKETYLGDLATMLKGNSENFPEVLKQIFRDNGFTTPDDRKESIREIYPNYYKTNLPEPIAL